MRNSERETVIAFAHKCKAREIKEEYDTVIDPKAMVIGFARRFATYKRPDMLLDNPEKLLKILQQPERPVQLLIAGKAHPDKIKGAKI